MQFILGGLIYQIIFRARPESSSEPKPDTKKRRVHEMSPEYQPVVTPPSETSHDNDRDRALVYVENNA